MIIDISEAECWSADGSEFNYDSLGELLDAHEELEVGNTVHFGQKKEFAALDFIGADDVIETIACRGADHGGEHAEDFPDVTKEAIAELDQLLHEWFDKHVRITFYSVKNSTEYELTAQDLPPDPPAGESDTMWCCDSCLTLNLATAGEKNCMQCGAPRPGEFI